VEEDLEFKPIKSADSKNNKNMEKNRKRNYCKD
jgi:hypothetical protein